MAKPMFLMIAMIVMAPMAAVVSATPSYVEFEQYCDFGFNDAQNTAYTPHDVVAYSSTVSIVEVDPGFYFITFDCTSGVQSGTLTIDVEGRYRTVVESKDQPRGCWRVRPSIAQNVAYFGNWAVDLDSKRVLWVHKFKEVLGWMNDFVADDKFAAGTSQMTIADIALLATYSTIKVN